MPQNSADGRDAGDAQGVERAVLVFDGERALHEQEQAEQRRQHDQARGDPAHQRRVVEGEAEHHHHDGGERQHLVEGDAAAPLDEQVLAGDQPRRLQPRHAAADRTVPPARSTTRVASGRARSDSWLATSTRGPRRRGLAQHGVELVASGGVEPGVRLVEQPQLGAAGDEAGEGGAPLLAGGQPAHRDAGEPAGETEPFERRVDLGRRGADRRAPERDVLARR